jgi:hypothetical protein
MPGKDIPVVVVHVVAGIQQYLLFEKNSGGRFVMETHRSQAFAYEILRRVNRYWPIVSGTGQKVGYPVMDPALPGRRGVEDFTPVMHMIPYRNIMVSRDHKQSRTSILTSLATRTGFRMFPRATATGVAKRPFRIVGSGGGRGCATATRGRGCKLRLVKDLISNVFRKSSRATGSKTTTGGRLETNFPSSFEDPLLVEFASGQESFFHALFQKIITRSIHHRGFR